VKVLQTIAIAVCASLFSCSVNRPSPSDAGADGSESKEADSIRIDDNTSRDLGISVVKVAELPAGTPVLATGQLQLNEDASWQVGAVTNGKIISVPVRVGDFVKEGQPLAILHSHDVHDARATYRQALAELAKQKAVADQARAVRDRTRRLFELRAASKQQLDAAETEYLSATTAVSIAQAEVR
jgi:Multidrug resistance efflux pump